jgi:glutamate/tyrosine decarboxylase-like PLP-dependent enzyme
VAGDLLTTGLNGSMYTYEMAPVYSLMEDFLFKYMKEQIGWETIEGILTPGGSIANLYGIISARHHKFP